MSSLAALSLLAALGAALPLPVRAAFSVPGFELVYTAPVDTELEPAGVRSPAEVWVEMLASARKEVVLGEFYIAPKAGEPLEPVLAELRRAGERGVKIRFLAEKKMAAASAEGFALLRAIPNLELRVLEFGGVQKGGILHAKYIVVDGREAFVGSQNFDWRSLKHIHEMGLRVTDPGIVRQVMAVFEYDWRAQKRLEAGKRVKPRNRKPPAAPRDRRAYLVASPWPHNPAGIGDSEAELVRLIGAAKKSLEVQVLDYAPLQYEGGFYAPLDNALRAAAVRGVAVRLMVSHWNTALPGIIHLKSLSLIPGVEIRIVTLPEARGGFIPYARVNHSKFMVVDGENLWLGTSNWSGGYLDKSRNLELVVRDAVLAGKTAELHRRLWDSPYAAPLELLKDYPAPRKS
ncbi:MAG TPA: phospholipase [Elusimicrobia bacterium]|nr:phospholipase [Elusimicrobiota bacterium]